MKKEDFLTLIVYGLMFVIALFIGLEIVSNALSQLGIYREGDQYLFAAIVILIGIIFNVVLFEVGHIIGAKIGGYKVLSVNILGLCWYRMKDKVKFGLKAFQGLTGETKIIANKEKANPKPYFLGPTILSVIVFVVAILLYALTPQDTMIHHVPLIISGIGVLILVYNIMPFKLETLTDGYYLVMLTKKINTEAYNELIRIESQIFYGEDIGDIKMFDEITTLTSRVMMYRIYQFIGKGDLDNALILINKILDNRRTVEEALINRNIAQKLYIILTKETPEAASKFWFEVMDGSQRKFVSNDLSLESLRAYLLYNGIVTKSQSECEYVISRAPKAVKNEFDDYRKQIEINLFKEVYEKVKANNPDWDLINLEI